MKASKHTREKLFESLETRRLLAYSGYAQLIGQDSAIDQYASITGLGQTVAVIDTGIDYTHPSLGGGFGAGKKVIGGYDFLSNDSDPMDTDGHGTAVAGMIAADRFTYQGVTYQGIAPDAKLVALRVGTEDNISNARIEQALQWVIANHETYGITVVNLSVGSGAYTADHTDAQLSDEFARLAELNISVFAASGNSGRSRLSGNGVAYPAADANVAAVGAVTSSDAVAEYTQRGATLDLLAPGDDVISTALGGAFEVVSGTSFASPIAAGAAALVRQVANWLDEKDVMSILRTSGTTAYDGDNETGRVSQREYSRINIRDAIRTAMQRTTSMLSTLAIGNTAIDSAYDLDGVLHLAYYDQSSGSVLVTTRLSNGKWSRPIAASDAGADAGQYLSLAIDQAGKPAVAFYDATHGDVRLASMNGGLFSTAAIDSAGNVGRYVSLAFDSGGNAAISYYDATNADLKFASGNRRAGYSASTIDSAGNVGTWTRIATDSSTGTSIIAIAYADETNGDLKYTRNAPGITGSSAWTTFVVDDLDGVANIDLSLHGGRAAIAYRDTLRGDVKYAYRNTDWFTETISAKGALGLAVDLYYDSAGALHVAYYNRTKDATYDATRSDAGVWSTTRIGTGGRAITVAEDFSTAAAQTTRLFLDRPKKTVRVVDELAE